MALKLAATKLAGRISGDQSFCDLSFVDVTAAELFLLGRKLMQLAERALPANEMGTTVRLVLMDIAYHPDSSISEITERTGFLQSHVSASVARLRALGAVETEVDPHDRRRTLVRITPMTIELGRNVRAMPIEGVLAPVLGGSGEGDGDDGDEVAEVVDALELLARRLMPRALAQLRAKVAS